MLGYEIGVASQRVACAFDLHDDGVVQEPIQNSVPWRINYAIGKRTLNMIANWLFTACHLRRERFRSRDEEFGVR